MESFTYLYVFPAEKDSDIGAFDRQAEVPVSSIQCLDLGLSFLCLLATAMAEEVALGTSPGQPRGDERPPAWLPKSLATVLTLSHFCAA